MFSISISISIYIYTYIDTLLLLSPSYRKKGLYTHGNIAHALAVYRAEAHILTAKKETFGLGAI